MISDEMVKMAGFRSGMKKSLETEKVALSLKTMSQAAGKRSMQAYRKGGGGLAGVLGVPTPSTFRGLREQINFARSSKGGLYARSINRAMQREGKGRGSVIANSSAGALKEFAGIK